MKDKVDLFIEFGNGIVLKGLNKNHRKTNSKCF